MHGPTQRHAALAPVASRPPAHTPLRRAHVRPRTRRQGVGAELLASPSAAPARLLAQVHRVNEVAPPRAPMPDAIIIPVRRRHRLPPVLPAAVSPTCLHPRREVSGQAAASSASNRPMCARHPRRPRARTPPPSPAAPLRPRAFPPHLPVDLHWFRRRRAASPRRRRAASPRRRRAATPPSAAATATSPPAPPRSPTTSPHRAPLALSALPELPLRR